MLKTRKSLALFVVIAVLMSTTISSYALSVPASPGETTATPQVTPGNNPNNSNNQPAAIIENTPTVQVVTPEIRAQQQRAKKIQNQIEQLARQIAAIAEAYNNASLELTRTTERLTEVRNRLRWFEAELQAQRELINERVVQLYKHGEVSPLEVIMNSTSFRDFLVRFNLLVRIGANDAGLVGKIHLQKRKIEEAKLELEQLSTKQTKLKSDLAKKKSEVLAKLKDYRGLLAGVDAQTRVLMYEEAAREATEQASLRNRFRLGINVKPGSVVAVAMQYLGIPYVWGGENPEIGFDCSGLTRYVYLQFGVDMPHWVPYQWDMGIPVQRGNEQPGDLVFFNDLGHVGIYVGDGYFIHAPRTGDYVKISELSKRKDYMGARRYIIDSSTGQ